jgi:hypothetical protein
LLQQCFHPNRKTHLFGKKGKTKPPKRLALSKIIKALLHIFIVRRTKMPKKEKPLTKKERDEKRKAKKAKQSKTQTS